MRVPFSVTVVEIAALFLGRVFLVWSAGRPSGWRDNSSRQNIQRQRLN
jgi:hypothetical protein